MRKQISPSSEFNAQVKKVAIAWMIERGIFAPEDKPLLDALPHDDVLDHIFLHARVIRIRVEEDRYVEIYPGRPKEAIN